MQVIIGGHVEDISISMITLIRDPHDLLNVELKKFHCINPQCGHVVAEHFGMIAKQVEWTEPTSQMLSVLQCRFCKKKYIFRSL